MNPAAVAALAEVGIDISAEQPKILTDTAVRESDVVITMGCGDTCPFYPGKRYEDWVLDDPAGVIRRLRSEGDRRRSYVTLRNDNPVVWAAAMSARLPGGVSLTASRVIFVCTANSARSQLAAARWGQLSSIPAISAGTHAGPKIHPRAVATGRRHGLELHDQRPTQLPEKWGVDDLLVVVCDNAHEELDLDHPRLHWSVPDPVRVNTDAAFERAYADLDRRVHRLADQAAS